MLKLIKSNAILLIVVILLGVCIYAILSLEVNINQSQEQFQRQFQKMKQWQVQKQKQNQKQFQKQYTTFFNIQPNKNMKFFSEEIKCEPYCKTWLGFIDICSAQTFVCPEIDTVTYNEKPFGWSSTPLINGKFHILYWDHKN